MRRRMRRNVKKCEEKRWNRIIIGGIEKKGYISFVLYNFDCNSRKDIILHAIAFQGKRALNVKLILVIIHLYFI